MDILIKLKLKRARVIRDSPWNKKYLNYLNSQIKQFEKADAR